MESKINLNIANQHYGQIYHFEKAQVIGPELKLNSFTVLEAKYGGIILNINHSE